MSPKGFILLAGAAVVSIGLAVGAVAGRDLPITSGPVSEPLFQGLMDRLNDVRTVRITTPETMLTVQARDKGWVLVEKGGYPVEPAKVRELVLGLANLQLVEAKTANPERLKRLELEEPAGKDTKSRRIELLDKDGKPLAAAVVGKTKYGLYGGGRAGVYVRRAGEDQAWLAAGALDLPSEPLDLLNRDIIDVPQDKITRVTLGVDGPTPIVIHRPDAAATTYAVDAVLPEGREIDQDKVERVAGVLAGLTMQDVKPAAEVTFPPEARRSRFETFDGLLVDVAVVRTGEGDQAEHWVRFAAAAQPTAAPAPAQPATPPADPASAQSTANPQPPTAAPAEKSAMERAREFNTRLAAWAYKVTPYLADRLGATLDGLLADRQGTS